MKQTERKDVKVTVSVNEKRAICNHYDKNGNATSVNDYQIKKTICKEYDIMIMDGQIYIYHDGVYRKNGHLLYSAIEHLMEENLIKSTTKKRVYDLFFQDHMLIKKREDVNNYSNTMINFKNGMFDAKKWTIAPHDPFYFCMNQIDEKIEDFKINEKNNHPVFTRFIESAIPNEEDREMFLQYVGLCLTKDATQQAFLMIQGQSDTGKSVVCNLISDIIGKENKSDISLQQMQDKFCIIQMMDKLVNICADIPSKAIESTGEIKQLLGEDSVTACFKHQDYVSFKSYAKAVFSCNIMPKIIGDNSDAIYNRMRVLKMNVKPKTKDRELLNKLKKERKEIIKTCLQALNRLYASDRLLDSKSSIEEKRKLKELSDSVTGFFNNCIEIKESNKILRSDLYSHYIKFCTEEERTPMKKGSFFTTIDNKGYRQVKNDGIMVYKGIDIAWEVLPENLKKLFKK